MFAIVPLGSVVDVVKHNHTGDEVDHFARREEVQVGPAVPSSVTVAGRGALRRQTKVNHLRTVTWG